MCVIISLCDPVYTINHEIDAALIRGARHNYLGMRLTSVAIDLYLHDCCNYANAVCCTAEPPWRIVSTANTISIAVS